jgi:hypothetical protein
MWPNVWCANQEHVDLLCLLDMYSYAGILNNQSSWLTAKDPQSETRCLRRNTPSNEHNESNQQIIQKEYRLEIKRVRISLNPARFVPHSLLDLADCEGKWPLAA